MNLIKKITLFSFLIFGMLSVFSQQTTSEVITKPAPGKSLIYIVRSGAGFIYNFRFYDKETYLGAIAGDQYLVYECEPGQHTFWAASENRDYIDANLEANSVYVLNAEGQTGMFIAGVNLKPLNPTVFADKKLFYRAIKSDSKVLFTHPTDNKSENVKKGLEKYDELKKSNSKKIRVLESNMKFENADKPTR